MGNPYFNSLNPEVFDDLSSSEIDEILADPGLSEENVEFLKAKGIFKNTIIVFTSDNGPAAEYGAHPDKFGSNGPFAGYKRDVFEGGMRVPTFVSWPGNPAASMRAPQGGRTGSEK